MSKNMPAPIPRGPQTPGGQPTAAAGAKAKSGAPGAPGGPGGPGSRSAKDSGEPVEIIDDIPTSETVMGKVMPWMISILVHSAIILLGVLLVYVTVKEHGKLEEEEVIIPVVSLGVKPGGPKVSGVMPGITGSPTAPREIRTTSVSKYKDSLGGAQGAGAGPTSGAGAGSAKVSTGLSGIIGTGGGTGGGNPKGSPFGSVQGFGDGPFRAPTMYGTGGGNAKKIVFCIDASGSLMDSIPFVIQELRLTLGQMSDAQSFTIIFFQGGSSVEVPPKGLKPATTEEKARVLDWINLENGNVSPQGITRPVEAVQTGLSYQPDLMFILSDNITGQGRYELDQKILLDEIIRANKKHTKINTIQFLQEDRLVQFKMQPTMKLIAEKTGGIYRFVKAADIGLEQP